MIFYDLDFFFKFSLPPLLEGFYERKNRLRHNRKGKEEVTVL